MATTASTRQRPGGFERQTLKVIRPLLFCCANEKPHAMPKPISPLDSDIAEAYELVNQIVSTALRSSWRNTVNNAVGRIIEAQNNATDETEKEERRQLKRICKQMRAMGS
jgi:hypothetical protein